VAVFGRGNLAGVPSAGIGYRCTGDSLGATGHTGKAAAPGAMIRKKTLA